MKQGGERRLVFMRDGAGQKRKVPDLSSSDISWGNISEGSFLVLVAV